ncbi:MAG: AbrB/MazE/SpoVT family DNA-binding domain-containing protein [Gammaproteobacteria bacterium]|nr:AbrB/MazE/SpoVT family DNA-binding domain-containing protein [Gammaproteobacteria bacterium]
MTTGTIFTNNRTQAVRLPAELRFPASVKKVHIRAVGKERVISPAESTWDSFFLDQPSSATDDFMKVRPSQQQAEREDF